MGNSIESDVYIGSSLGTISIFTSQKHFFMKEKAHHGSINCIRVTDVFNQAICVVTAGEDGFIKIWSPRIELLQAVDVKRVNPTPDLTNP
jgi:WD40 repeat protein